MSLSFKGNNRATEGAVVQEREVGKGGKDMQVF